MNNRIRFILDGCDISFVAEASADITLEQLLRQCDKIHPDWCACGIRSCRRDPRTGDDYEITAPTEIIIDYDSVQELHENDEAMDAILCNPAQGGMNEIEWRVLKNAIRLGREKNPNNDFDVFVRLVRKCAKRKICAEHPKLNRCFGAVIGLTVKNGVEIREKNWFKNHQQFDGYDKIAGFLRKEYSKLKSYIEYGTDALDESSIIDRAGFSQEEKEDVANFVAEREVNSVNTLEVLEEYWRATEMECNASKEDRLSLDEILAQRRARGM